VTGACHRDRWLTEVLRTDELNNSCKLVLVAMSRQMDEKGRVRYPREKLAADVGLKTVQRVTDRIKEAKEAGFLIADGGGINGTVAQYYAQIPGTPLRGTSSRGRGNGSRGTRNGVPDSGQEAAPGTPPRGAIRARATYKNRGTEPAPVGSRVEREHSLNSRAGTCREWMATPLTSLPSVPRTEVA
jgi:hypothetical protein